MNLRVSSLTQKYGSQTILHDLTFTAESGKITALLGLNGSGKSTLIKTIAGILPCPQNTIFANETDITTIHHSERARMIGYVPQHFHYTSFTTVLDTVLIGRRPYMSWSVSEEDLKAVDDAMNAMNVAEISNRYINELSGGQRQRVFIARALAQNPAFYLFDEPTSSLDLRHQLETLTVMQNLVRKNGAGMIVALHDLNLALHFADSIILLKDGKIIATGTPETVLTAERVAEVYGVKADVFSSDHGTFIHAYDPVKNE
ncbi:MAG TPA: ABC transporter ATP-binding protein [Methanocorpusculum sp.]|nr:ABC transporter ATP-binding protein [Methanocorpusculum sp.]